MNTLQQLPEQTGSNGFGLEGQLGKSSGLAEGRIKVGIISTSFNAESVLEKDILEKELPSDTTILKDLPFDSVYATDEGRALAQIVYDIAPNAELLFHTGVGGDGSSLEDLDEGSFSTAVNSLMQAGADIIFDDIANLFPTLFEDGVAAQAVEDAVEAGIVYLSAAGNNGAISYESEYRPTEEFQFAGLRFQAHDFDPTSAVDLFQDVSVDERGALLKPLLSWDSADRKSNDELFLFVLDSPSLPNEGNVLNISVVPSESTVDEPVTTQIYSAAPNQKLYYAIAGIPTTETLPPSRLKWISTANGADRRVEYEYVDPLLGRSTVFGPANAQSAITVGSASDDGTQYDSFASRGSIPVLFDDEGNRLSKPTIRRKPDVIGPDNVPTAFPEGSQFNPFVGTSAAVPYVAGVVALMEEAAGGPDVLEPETIKFILGATDKPVEPAPGLPPSAGLVQPDAAVLGAKIAGEIATLFPNLSV